MTDDSPLPPSTTPIVASMDASSRLVWGMLAAAVLCIAAIAALPGLFFGDTGYFHDLFVTLDIIYRTHAGQHSSLDYFGPIGPFVEWIYRLALLLAPPTARILNLGNALIALLALGLSWITLRRRADPTVMALVALTVVTVSLTGLNPDRPLPLFQVSHLAPYNYWGWALFCPVALRTMLPAGKTSDWPGTIACALALGWAGRRRHGVAPHVLAGRRGATGRHGADDPGGGSGQPRSASRLSGRPARSFTDAGIGPADRPADRRDADRPAAHRCL